LWALLLADSIIFQTELQTRIKLKTQKRATNFLNHPTEKSFNREQQHREQKENLRPKSDFAFSYIFSLNFASFSFQFFCVTLRILKTYFYRNLFH